MKTVLLISAMLLLNIASYSQTYKSSFASVMEDNFKTDFKDRVITISDKEITVTNFLNGETETWRMIVNRIENKQWMLDGMQKTYYCTSTDKDFISGTYRKAIAHKTSTGTFRIADFADEMTVFTYDFHID